MRKFISTAATILFQILTTFALLFVVYMIFALLDNDEADLINETALFVIEPIYGIVFSTLTIVACIIVGLPIRLIARLYKWWSSKPLIAFAGIIIGLILLAISYNSHFIETTNVIIDGESKTKQIPNITLVLTGWFLTAFCLLHFYPLTIIKRFKTKLFSKELNKNEYSTV